MMKLNKQPLSYVISALLLSTPVFAADTTQSDSTSTDAKEQSSDQTGINWDGLTFSGYARYGAHLQEGDEKYVGVVGSYNGSSGIGRLGNEANGGEFQLNQKFNSSTGANWDLVVMFDHWGDEVNLKKAYAGADHIFKSQPNAYIWAGRDFHQRPQQGINDYFWMSHDGQGAGIKYLDFGFAKLDLGVVSRVDNCEPAMIEEGDNPSRISCTGGANVGDDGRYAITSKLYDIQLTDFATLDIYANYGFDSDGADYADDTPAEQKDLNAYQIATVFNTTWDKGWNRFYLRYADNADNSVYSKTNDLTTFYASLEGNMQVNPKTEVEYILAYHDYDVDGSNEAMDNRTNYAAIVRPMYNWNDIHSTWLEAGYQIVDFDNESNDQNSGWKFTFSQNIAIDVGSTARPMLRFYATVGETDNEYRPDLTSDKKRDTVSLGAMFEAWW